MKKSFVLYTEWKEMFDSLDKNQAGELIQAIFAYQAGIEIELSPALSPVFIFIKQTLKRDNENWNKIREQRQVSGSIGGKMRVANQANATFAKQKQAKASKSKQKQANQAVNVNGNVNVNVNDREILPHKKFSYLEELQNDVYPEDMKTYMRKFNCTTAQIKQTAEKIINWCKSNGKKKKDYKATMNNWLIRDYGSREFDGYKRL